MLFTILKILFYIPLRLILPVKVINPENLKTDKRVIYACNHQANFDSVICALVIHKKTYFMAKKELFKSKFAQWFLKQMHAFPVDRQNVDLKSIRIANSILNKENGLMIYPQGTRKKYSQDFASLKNGVVFFAVKNKTPVIPMMFDRKIGVFKFTKLIVGEPMYFTEYYDKKLTKEVLNEASDKLIIAMNDLLINKDTKKTR